MTGSKTHLLDDKVGPEVDELGQQGQVLAGEGARGSCLGLIGGMRFGARVLCSKGLQLLLGALVGQQLLATFVQLSTQTRFQHQLQLTAKLMGTRRPFGRLLNSTMDTKSENG